MGDHEHRAGIFLQVVFQPAHAFCVEVVGWLVEQQDVGLLNQQAGQRDAALFTTRKVGHVPVARRAAQSLHGDFQLVVERPAVDSVDLGLQVAHFLHQGVEIDVLWRVGHDVAYLVETVDQIGGGAGAILHVFQHRLAGVQLRFLLQIAGGDILARPCLAGEILVDAGHDLDQRGLASAVGADDADLGTLIELQADVAEHRLGSAGEGFGHVLHDVGVLRGHGAGLRNIAGDGLEKLRCLYPLALWPASIGAKCFGPRLRKLRRMRVQGGRWAGGWPTTTAKRPSAAAPSPRNTTAA